MYIFDIDGTLLYTIDTISYYINKALADFGLGNLPKEEVRKNVGNGPVVLVKKCLSYLGIEDKQSLEKVLAYYNKIYDDNPSYLTKPYPGIKEELEKIKQRGELLVAFSNKPDSTCKKVLVDIWGRDYFDMILGFKEEIERKPSPEGLYIIGQRFGEKMTDIIYFGDSEVDIKCGRNAGVFTVACAWGFRDKDFLIQQNPDAIIDSPDLINTIRRV
ncbi:MAG: HAD-IA family hydrolase [Peptoniphilaceae bacterium]|nr:HAD-IA family hydrolase [Peptoniphilaceae bacterium]MDY6018765.1 HAD-IA family hydrolase [Anaerococcus sp.]